MDSNKGKIFKGIEQRFNEGDRTMLVVPFDYRLLEVLPAEGTNFADLYQIGMTVKEIAALFPPEVTTSKVAARLVPLNKLGLIRSVMMLQGRGSRAWQQTTKGKEEMEKWQQTQQ